MGTDDEHAFHPHSKKNPLRSLRLCERDFVRLESLTYGLSQPSFHGER